MSDTTRDPRRFGTRTWHPEVVAAPVAQVQDEAMRAILDLQQRAYLGMANEIRRRIGLRPLHPDTPDDEAA